MKELYKGTTSKGQELFTFAPDWIEAIGNIKSNNLIKLELATQAEKIKIKKNKELFAKAMGLVL